MCIRDRTGIRAKPRVLGAVGYDFALVARGTAMLGLAATPHLWDLAGGWLLVTEAGGVVNVIPDRSGALQTPFPAQAGINYRDLTFPPVSYTHLRAHETVLDLVCRLLLEKKKNTPPHAHIDIIYPYEW